MDRRSFLASMAALFGAVVAKVKVAPTDHLAAYGEGTYKLTIENGALTDYKKLSGDFLYFAERHIYVHGKDGFYKWKPTATQKHLLGFKPIDTE